MFLFICKLFLKEKVYEEYGLILFIFFVFCIFKDLDKMKIENSYYYVVLILMVVNDNILLEEILDNGNINVDENSFYEMKNNFLKKCKVQSNIDIF